MFQKCSKKFQKFSKIFKNFQRFSISLKNCFFEFGFFGFCRGMILSSGPATGQVPSFQLWRLGASSQLRLLAASGLAMEVKSGVVLGLAAPRCCEGCWSAFVCYFAAAPIFHFLDMSSGVRHARVFRMMRFLKFLGALIVIGRGTGGKQSYGMLGCATLNGEFTISAPRQGKTNHNSQSAQECHSKFHELSKR